MSTNVHEIFMLFSLAASGIAPISLAEAHFISTCRSLSSWLRPLRRRSSSHPRGAHRRPRRWPHRDPPRASSPSPISRPCFSLALLDLAMDFRVSKLGSCDVGSRYSGLVSRQGLSPAPHRVAHGFTIVFGFSDKADDHVFQSLGSSERQRYNFSKPSLANVHSDAFFLASSGCLGPIFVDVPMDAQQHLLVSDVAIAGDILDQEITILSGSFSFP